MLPSGEISPFIVSTRFSKRVIPGCRGSWIIVDNNNAPIPSITKNVINIFLVSLLFSSWNIMIRLIIKRTDIPALEPVEIIAKNGINMLTVRSRRKVFSLDFAQ